MQLPVKPKQAEDWSKIIIPPTVTALDSSSPDGYAGILAPELPGDVATPTATQNYAGAAFAASNALAVCMAAISFWDASAGSCSSPQVLSKLSSLANLLQSGDEAPSVDTIKLVAINTEELLVSQQCMQPRWTSVQGRLLSGTPSIRWRASIQVATQLRDVVLHLPSLCSAVAWRRTPTLHRALPSPDPPFMDCIVGREQRH